MNNSTKQFKNTYDYYKDRPSEQTWYETYFYNENGHVFFESPKTPRQCMKGVWQVIRPFSGVGQYVPEGDPEFDKNGYLMVWGKFQLNGNPSANQIAEQYS